MRENAHILSLQEAVVCCVRRASGNAPWSEVESAVRFLDEHSANQPMRSWHASEAACNVVPKPSDCAHPGKCVGTSKSASFIRNAAARGSVWIASEYLLLSCG